MRLSMPVVTRVAWMAAIVALLRRSSCRPAASPPTNVVVAVNGPTLNIRWNAPASGPPELRYGLNFYSGDTLVASVNADRLVHVGHARHSARDGRRFHRRGGQFRRAIAGRSAWLPTEFL